MTKSSWTTFIFIKKSVLASSPWAPWRIGRTSQPKGSTGRTATGFSYNCSIAVWTTSELLFNQTCELQKLVFKNNTFHTNLPTASEFFNHSLVVLYKVCIENAIEVGLNKTNSTYS